MRETKKNESNTNKRGLTMAIIKNNFKKAFYLVSGSVFVYAVIKAFIMADGFANSL